MRALQGVILFTVIEIITLVVWLILAGLPFAGVSTGKAIGAVVVLTVGLFLEHYVSVNVGAGRPPFGPLPEDKESL